MAPTKFTFNRLAKSALTETNSGIRQHMLTPPLSVFYSELKRAAELRKILEAQAKKQAELFKTNNVKAHL